MFTDIVLIKDKKEAIELSKRLGYSNVLFLTERNFISNIKDINKAQKPIIVIGGNDDINRAALSNSKVNILLHPETNKHNGLNQVLCKLAHDNNVAIGISFNKILNEKDRINLLSKIIQNIRLCRKYKVKVIIASFANNIYEMRSAKDLISFMRVLGSTPLDAKNSLLLNNKII